MHEAMLDGDVEHLHELRMAFFRVLERMFDGVIKFFAQAPVVTLDFLPRGPIFRSIGWQTASDGVDTERKKLIEGFVERAQTESALRKEVPVKGFDVAKVKNDAVALRDGPVVDGLFAYQLEKLIGAGAGLQQAAMKIVSDADSRCGECSHGVDPFF